MTLAKIIKATIRDARTGDTPACERDVKATLREHCKNYKAACETFERLRKHGEIYSYETNGDRIVKITDDTL